jgi:hypothetical protein
MPRNRYWPEFTLLGMERLHTAHVRRHQDNGGVEDAVMLQKVSEQVRPCHERAADADAGTDDSLRLQEVSTMLIQEGCWPGKDFILNQPPSGSGFILISRRLVAEDCRINKDYRIMAISPPSMLGDPN